MLTLSGVNGGSKHLVSEFHQRFALSIHFGAAPLLNEGISHNVSDQVEVVKQCFGFLIREVRSLKQCSTHLGSDTACLLVRTG